MLPRQSIHQAGKSSLHPSRENQIQLGEQDSEDTGSHRHVSSPDLDQEVGASKQARNLWQKQDKGVWRPPQIQPSYAKKEVETDAKPVACHGRDHSGSLSQITCYIADIWSFILGFIPS